MLIQKSCYKAVILQTLSQINKYYYIICEKTFKERYNNHTATFRNKSKQKSTQFSKQIWEVKGNSIQRQINWDIASRARPYNGCTRISKYRHMNKFILKCFKTVNDNYVALVKSSYSKSKVKL